MVTRILLLALGLTACGGDDAPAQARNRAPVPGPLEVATNEFTPVTLDVVAVAKDAAGQFLTILRADADTGEAAIADNQTLRYTPAAPGPVTVRYVLADNYGAAASGTATVIVTEGKAVRIVSFMATPDIVVVGSPATLQWNVSTADSCTIEPGVGAVGASGSQTVTPVVQTNYTLTCEGPGGPVSASAQVLPDGDFDGDGLADAFEARVGTSPMDRDSDDDGIPDNEEDVNGNGLVDPGETDPRNPATDGVFCDYLREDNDGDGLTPPADCRQRTVLSTGPQHSCVVLPTGAVRCWGNNGYGALGYAGGGIVGDDRTPASMGDVPLGGKAVEVAAGSYHTCALLRSGAVRCWGRSNYGQLGYGYKRPDNQPLTPEENGDVDVGGTAIRIVAGSSHTCALLASGGVRCWGRGDLGQLGYGATADIGDDETPASAGDVALGGKAIDLAAGYYHTCAVLEGGTLRCWGLNLAGVLGLGNSTNIGDDELPTAVDPVDVGGKVLEVSVGASTCVRMAVGVKCWGYGETGLLGNLSLANYGSNEGEVPSALGVISIGGVVTQISTRADHGCALIAGGSLRCWGANDFGQLGHGSNATIGDNETPASVGDVQVGGEVLQVSNAYYNTCVKLKFGVVRCWGLGADGRLGYPYGGFLGDGPDEVPSAMPDVPYR